MQTTRLNAITKGAGIGKRTLIVRLEESGNATYHTNLAAYYHSNGNILELNDATPEERVYIEKTFTGLKLQLQHA